LIPIFIFAWITLDSPLKLKEDDIEPLIIEIVLTYLHAVEYSTLKSFSFKPKTLEINLQIEKRKGDQAVFTFLLILLNEVYGFMLKRTGNETNAEDITIETFPKLNS
jgi:hypothetical protein